MNNAEFSRKPKNSLTNFSDDIPAALRDNPDVSASKVNVVRPIILFIGGVAGFISLAIISGFMFSLTAPKTATNSQPNLNHQTTTQKPSDNKKSADFQNNTSDRILGHFAYF